MKPFYDEDGITIYHGDCLEVLPILYDVDLIITSPPYNLGTTTGGGFGPKSLWGTPELMNGYESSSDAMPVDDYEKWQREVLRTCWSVLAEDGAIFYNHKPRVQAGLLWTPLMVNPDLPLRQIIIWNRPGGMNFCGTHFLPAHEWIVVLAKPNFRLRDKGASGLSDVWTFPAERGVVGHPAPFPVGLPARIIRSTQTGSSLIVDPFMGSGSTLVAAKAAGVPAIGIEIEEKYCEIAVQRLAQGVLNFADSESGRS